MKLNRRIVISLIDLLRKQELSSHEINIVNVLEAMQSEIEDLKQEIKDK